MILSIASFILLALNPSKLPFLIASYMPFFALGIAIILRRFWSGKPFGDLLDESLSQRFAAVVTVVALTALLAIQVRDFQNRQSHHFNSDQRLLLREFSDYIGKLPAVKLYDGLGLVPSLPLSPFFIGPGQLEENKKFPDYLTHESFSLIAATQKVMLMDVKELLPKSYIPSASGLWRKAWTFQTDSNAQLTAAHFFEGLESVFTWETSALSAVYFYTADNQPVVEGDFRVLRTDADGKQQRVTLNLQNLRPTDIIVFPTSGTYRMTIFPEFHSATNQEFINSFRFFRKAPLSPGAGTAQ